MRQNVRLPQKNSFACQATGVEDSSSLSRPLSLLPGECPHGAHVDLTRTRQIFGARNNQKIRRLEEQKKMVGVTLSNLPCSGN